MNQPKRLFVFNRKIEDRYFINLTTSIALMFLLALSISVSAFARGNPEEAQEPENQEPYILDEIVVTEKGYGVKQNLTATKNEHTAA